MNGNRLNLKLYHPNDITVRSEKTQRIRKCWYKYWNLQNVLSRLRDTPWMWQQHQSLQTLLPNAPSTRGTCRTNTTTRWLRPHRNKQKIKDEIRSSVTVDLTWLIVVASSPPGRAAAEPVHPLWRRDAPQEDHRPVPRGAPQGGDLREDGPPSGWGEDVLCFV